MDLVGLLPIDKPLGWTSHDVVARARRFVGTRRVGHAGTLDPAATGVLVLGVGRATRFLDYVQAGEKAYVAHIVLGATTDTFDIDGRIGEANFPVLIPSIDEIQRCISQFIGEIDQIPPKYSAVKQAGEPLYRRMRRGEAVDVPVRSVRISNIGLLSYRYPDLLIEIECGSGVYIRSLAADLGERLSCGAYLHHLLRTRVGSFHLEACWTIDDLVRRLTPETWTNFSTATDGSIATSEAASLSAEQTRSWYHGRSVRADWLGSRAVEVVRAYSHSGEFAGTGSLTSSRSGQAELRPRIVLEAN